MSKSSFTRGITDTVIDNRTYHIIAHIDPDPWWNECVKYHRTPNNDWRKGKNWKKRRLLNYQVRMYRTWKHNRRYQWKE